MLHTGLLLQQPCRSLFNKPNLLPLLHSLNKLTFEIQHLWWRLLARTHFYIVTSKLFIQKDTRWCWNSLLPLFLPSPTLKSMLRSVNTWKLCPSFDDGAQFMVRLEDLETYMVLLFPPLSLYTECIINSHSAAMSMFHKLWIFLFSTPMGRNN